MRHARVAASKRPEARAEPPSGAAKKAIEEAKRHQEQRGPQGQQQQHEQGQQQVPDEQQQR